MFRKVLIKEKGSGEVVTIESVYFSGADFDPSEDEALNLAWQNAVNDKLLSSDKKNSYILEFE